MYKLRPYQQDAVNNTIRYFRKKREPAVIVLPTGAGKSLVIAELARIAKGRVLVLAHVKELVEQNYEKYKSYGLSAGIFRRASARKSATKRQFLEAFNRSLGPPTIFLTTSLCWSSTNATESPMKAPPNTKRFLKSSLSGNPRFAF